MSRRLSAFASVITLLPLHSTAFAQSLERIGPDTEVDADCQRKQEAALISGEIVVCGNRAENDRHRLRSREDAQRDFANRTMDRGLALAPDFSPPPCKPNLLTFCSELRPIGEAPVMVDFSQLPESPEGSDADKVGKGEIPR